MCAHKSIIAHFLIGILLDTHLAPKLRWLRCKSLLIRHLPLLWRILQWRRPRPINPEQRYFRFVLSFLFISILILTSHGLFLLLIFVVPRDSDLSIITKRSNQSSKQTTKDPQDEILKPLVTFLWMSLCSCFCSKLDYFPTSIDASRARKL